MSTHKVYGRYREIELRPLEDGTMHYAELRFSPARGPIEDFCVGYKVWHGNEYAEIVRYDSHPGGPYHRHAAGYPEPGSVDKEFVGYEMHQRGAVAIKDITLIIETVRETVRKEELEK